MSALHDGTASPPHGPASPPHKSVEAWCWRLVTTTEFAEKLAPAPCPAPRDEASWERDPPARRVAAPGRPRELAPSARAARTPRPAALADPRTRARLLHAFLHHELQAAELFAWAVLAFPDAPRALRAGFARLAEEELAHLDLYARHLATLGSAPGAFPVRDWFWERVGSVPDARSFVALLGLGLEGANLDHGPRFAAALRAAGDERAARIVEEIGRDEVAHVAFARRWFERLSGAPLDYDLWRAALPAPLTPSLLQGRPLDRAARLRAGFSSDFLARLEGEPPAAGRRP